jgi:hypothetical protein
MLRKIRIVVALIFYSLLTLLFSRFHTELCMLGLAGWLISSFGQQFWL